LTRSSWLWRHSFSGIGLVVVQPGLDRRILRIEIGEVGHEVLDHRLVRQRIDLIAPLTSSMCLVQASVLPPSTFMAQEPHTPSRQERRKVSVGSMVFLIQISASSTIGPQSPVST